MFAAVVLISTALVSLTTILVILWYRHKYSYWKKQGVQGPTPNFPFGNLQSVVNRKAILATYLEQLYYEYDEPIVGIYTFYNPALVVRDPNVIKLILTKDSQYFDARGFPSDVNNILSTHLFNATGEQWKMLRTKLSPTFTSGKMKMMFNLMQNCADSLSGHVQNFAGSSEPLDFKDVMARYTTDVIVNCAFGVECNTLHNENLEFKKYGSRIVESTFLESLNIAVQLFTPELRRLVFLPFMNKVDVRDFFIEMFNETVRVRESTGQRRKDFLQLLIDLKHNYLKDDHGNVVKFEDDKGLPEELLIAQAFIFFVAGFETSSTAASFALYELAKHPDIQETARQEVVNVIKEHGGELNYDALHKMVYVNAIVDETLRKYPPLGMLFRRCTTNYRIPDTNVTIHKGALVFVPINALQKDPKYFPNPEEFDPERFLNYNQDKMNDVYMPFGQGPRFCIGLRFGMLQTKLALARLLLDFKIETSVKTPVEIKYDTASFTLSPEGGMWLRVKKLK